LSTIDIIFPFHRVDKNLTEALNSVRASTGVRVKLIAIDDRRDRSAPINFEPIASTGGIGYEKCINFAKKYLTSEYTALMNSDDLVQPHRFAAQIDSLDRSGLDISVTRLKKINSRGISTFMLGGNPRINKYIPGLSLISSHYANASWLTKSDFWFSNIQFDEQGIGSDWVTGLKLFQKHEPAVMTEALYLYRKHSQQITKLTEFSKNSFEDAWTECNAEMGLPHVRADFGLKIVFPQFLKSNKEYSDEDLLNLKEWIKQFRNCYPDFDSVLAPRVLNLYRDLNLNPFSESQSWIYRQSLQVGMKLAINKFFDMGLEK
jgi:hypothetical protein